MAQLVLKVLEKLCDIPGSSIFVPLLAPMIPTPMNILIFVPILLTIYYAPSNSFINGSNQPNGQRQIKPAALWSLLIYYVLMVIIYFFSFKKACEAAAMLPF